MRTHPESCTDMVKKYKPTFNTEHLLTLVLKSLYFIHVLKLHQNNYILFVRPGACFSPKNVLYIDFVYSDLQLDILKCQGKFVNNFGYFEYIL